jgi:hypothetical protein
MDATDPKSWNTLGTCTQQLYGITLKNFVPVAPGSNGYFFGIDRSGHGVGVETNPLWSEWGLALQNFSLPHPSGGVTHGWDPTYNYVASEIVDLESGSPLPPTQIHELGHSLDAITHGAFGSNESDRLWNCVTANR